MKSTCTHVTCGLWGSSLAYGFNLPSSYKFVMLFPLPLVKVRHNNKIIIIIIIVSVMIGQGLSLCLNVIEFTSHMKGNVNKVN